mgnify:CR=1 FL=1
MKSRRLRSACAKLPKSARRMSLAGILILSIFVSYLWTGWEMVEFHLASDPIDRPGYVKWGIGARLVSMLTWPVVSKLNNELAWFLATFVGSAALVAVAFYYLLPLEIPVWAIVAAIPLLRMLPMIRIGLNAPIAFIATLVFFILFRPFGAKMPSGMERMQ